MKAIRPFESPMKTGCPGGTCGVAVCRSQVAGLVVDLLVLIMRLIVCAAPAPTKRPFGVAVRPMLHCGEHGPRRLSELLAQDSNRGHVLVLECGAQRSLLSALPACHRRPQPVAVDGGALEGALLNVELAMSKSVPSRSIANVIRASRWATAMVAIL